MRYSGFFETKYRIATTRPTAAAAAAAAAVAAVADTVHERAWTLVAQHATAAMSQRCVPRYTAGIFSQKETPTNRLSIPDNLLVCLKQTLRQ